MYIFVAELKKYVRQRRFRKILFPVSGRDFASWTCRGSTFGLKNKDAISIFDQMCICYWVRRYMSEMLYYRITLASRKSMLIIRLNSMKFYTYCFS